MKKLILIISILFASFTIKAQKQDSLIIQIQMDTAVWKNIIQLINENINGQTLTGKIVLQNILAPLYQYKLVPRMVADKPKEIKQK